MSQIAHRKKHHDGYDYRGGCMSTRKAGIARQQSATDGSDRTRTHDQPFNAGYIYDWSGGNYHVAHYDFPV